MSAMSVIPSQSKAMLSQSVLMSAKSGSIPLKLQPKHQLSLECRYSISWMGARGPTNLEALLEDRKQRGVSFLHQPVLAMWNIHSWIHRLRQHVFLLLSLCLGEIHEAVREMANGSVHLQWTCI